MLSFPESSTLFIPFLVHRCKSFGEQFTGISPQYDGISVLGVRPLTWVSLVLTRFSRLGVYSGNSRVRLSVVMARQAGSFTPSAPFTSSPASRASTLASDMRITASE